MIRLSQSPTDPAFVQNPYPFYNRARAQAEVFWWDDYKMPCAVSYEAVRFALRDRRLGRQPLPGTQNFPETLAPFYAVEAHSMLELEPPHHTRLRGLVLRAFTSRRIAELAPEIEALCHRLVDHFPSGPFDLITQYAQPVPVQIIARLLGVPLESCDDLLKWSNAMVAMYQARRTAAIEAAAVQATLDFSAFLTDYIAQRRRAPRDDLISTLIAAEQDGEKLTTNELISTCILLLNAGHEATVHTIGNGVKTLFETDGCKITDACIEEILRYDPPLHMFTRWIYEDIEIAGVPLARGDQIGCLLGAANRDPDAFASPNHFDPVRPMTQNTSFGGGVHFCVGAPLARLEMKIALKVLFNRRPDLKITKPPSYANLYHFHGLSELMVK
jgi:cytochrome P450